MSAITLAKTQPYYLGSGTFLAYQRDVDNSTDVLLSGTYSGGTPTNLEASWQGGAFANLSSVVIAGGNWSGTLAGKAGGDGVLTVRWTNDVSATISTRLALGDYILVMGDSVALGTSQGSVPTAAGNFREWVGAGVGWSDTSGSNGGPWGELIAELSIQASVPTGYINKAASGSTTSQWVHGQTFFDDAVAELAVAGLNAVRAVVIHYGANDLIGGGPASVAAFEAALAATTADCHTYLPTVVPVFFAMTGDIEGGAPNSFRPFRPATDYVKQALLNKVADSTCYMGCVLSEQQYSDGVHPDPAHRLAIARRWYLAVSDVVYGTANGRGPRQSAVHMNAGQTSFVVTFDRALGNSLASAVAGFRVQNGDLSAATVTGATVGPAATQVTVTVSPAATGTPLVSFSSWNDAVGQTVPTTTTETLPQGSTVTRPAEPFLGVTATLASTSGIPRSRLQLCM